jgi:NitT/TauT family transport system permease protein
MVVGGMKISTRNNWNDIALNLMAVGLAFAIWHLLSLVIKFPYFPRFTDTVLNFYQTLFYPDKDGLMITSHIEASLIRVAVGYSAGCITGFLAGIALGRNPLLYSSTKIVLEPIRFIPGLAWMPVVYILIRGFPRYVIIIWITSFVVMWVWTKVAVEKINPIYVNVTRVLGANRFFVLWKIVIPSVMPDMFGAMRAALGLAWTAIVATEMVGGELTGLGRLIIKQSAALDISSALSTTLIIAILGLAMNEIMLRLEKLLVKWR